MEKSKKPDHRLKGLQDAVSFVGELEHARRHALRSFDSIERQLQDDALNEKLLEKSTHYAVIAERCQNIRRAFMEEKFGDVDDEDWCLLKTTAALRQLAYELMPTNASTLHDTELLVDSTWSHALGEDMSGCKSCKEDRENGDA